MLHAYVLHLLVFPLKINVVCVFFRHVVCQRGRGGGGGLSIYIYINNSIIEYNILCV